MRTLLVALMIALLPLRGWGGDAVAVAAPKDGPGPAQGATLRAAAATPLRTMFLVRMKVPFKGGRANNPHYADPLLTGT